MNLQLDLSKVDKTEISKNVHRQDLLESFVQIKSIRLKKMQKPSLKDFMDEVKAL